MTELMLERPEAAARLGIGVTKYRELIKAGHIREVEISPRCKRTPESEIERYISHLKQQAEELAAQRLAHNT